MCATRLSTALREQFARRSPRSGDRIRESIAPYSRFVRAEGDKLKAVEQELREIGNEPRGAAVRIERLRRVAFPPRISPLSGPHVLT